MVRRLLATSLLFLSFPAAAQEGRSLCTDRPGLGTPACTVEEGRIVLEVGIANWTRDSDAQSKTDTIAAGDMLLRFGLGDHLEAQFGWTAYGHERERDRLTGDIDRSSGTGDVTLALRRNFRNPDRSKVSVALMPHVTLPTGGVAIGDGDWSAGMTLPGSIELAKGVLLELVGEVDAAADEDRHGRHLAYGGVTGLDIDLTKAIKLAVETSLMRDNDPQGHETQTLLGLSLAYKLGKNRQFDIGWNGGLNQNSPNTELYFGFVQRF